MTARDRRISSLVREVIEQVDERSKKLAHNRGHPLEEKSFFNSYHDLPLRPILDATTYISNPGVICVFWLALGGRGGKIKLFRRFGARIGKDPRAGSFVIVKIIFFVWDLYVGGREIQA